MKRLLIWGLLSSGAVLAPMARADTADGAALDAMSWDQIVEMARGGTVT